MEELLDLTLTYSFKDKESHTKVRKFFSDVLVNSIEYLRRNNLHLNGKTDVLGIMNSIVGNVLFARGTEVEINKVKTDGDKLIKSVFKSSGLTPENPLESELILKSNISLAMTSGTYFPMPAECDKIRFL